MIEASLYTKLTGVAAITALVSTRIYPNEAPRGESFPYITYSKISTSRKRTLQGSDGLTLSRIQIEAISDKYTDVKSVGDAIRSALDSRPANTYPQTWGSVRVQVGIIEDQGDSFETPKSAEDQLIHREQLDLLVWWEES